MEKIVALHSDAGDHQIEAHFPPRCPSQSGARNRDRQATIPENREQATWLAVGKLGHGCAFLSKIVRLIVRLAASIRDNIKRYQLVRLL